MGYMPDELFWFLAGTTTVFGIQAIGGLIYFIVDSISSTVRSFRSLKRFQSRQQQLERERKEEKVIRYLVSDNTMELTKTIAGMLNVAPDSEEFKRIYKAITAQLERYEEEAERQNLRVSQCLSFE